MFTYRYRELPVALEKKGEVRSALARELRLNPEQIFNLEVERFALDSRRKGAPPWVKKLAFVPVSDDYCSRVIHISCLRDAHRTACLRGEVAGDLAADKGRGTGADKDCGPVPGGIAADPGVEKFEAGPEFPPQQEQTDFIHEEQPERKGQIPVK